MEFGAEGREPFVVGVFLIAHNVYYVKYDMLGVQPLRDGCCPVSLGRLPVRLWRPVRRLAYTRRPATHRERSAAMYAVAFRRSVTEGAMFDVNALLAEVEECIDMAPMDWIAALKAAAEWCRQTIVTKQQAREP